MKSTFLKISLMAFIAMGAFACKNTEKEAEMPMEEVAEATEEATAAGNGIPNAGFCGS